MKACVNHRDHSGDLGDILRCGVPEVYVTIQEHCPGLCRTVERLGAEPSETAVEIHRRSGKSIIGALHIAILEKRPPRTHKRTHIKTAYKTAIPCKQAVSATAYTDLSLNNGITPLSSVQFRAKRIFKIHIAIIAESHVLQLKRSPDEMHHREIAKRTLSLPSVHGKHHIRRIGGKTYDLKRVTLHLHPIRNAVAV